MTRTATLQRAGELLLDAGHRDEAARLFVDVFQARPSVWTCKKVLEAAPAGQRAQHAREMLAALKDKPDLDLALELYLTLGNVDVAVDLVSTPGTYPGQKARVAAALAAVDLDQAALLWRTAVESRIREQHRGAYAEAAGWLAEMRAALLAAERAADWQRYLAGLWAKYPRHRALHQELDQAGVR